MPDLEPFILLPAQQTEYTRKPGGGGAKPPIVPVTAELRTNLAEQLAPAIAAASSDFTLAAQGIPLTLRLREEALAKTRRPYDLLNSVSMPPVAAERHGELVARASSASLRALQETLESGQTKADIYAISTIESFHVWDPISDALCLAEGDTPSSILEDARARDIPLRVELFPWLSAQSLLVNTGETLADFLEDLGLPVRLAAGSEGRTTLYLDVQSTASVNSFAGLYGVRSAMLTPSYSLPKTVRKQSFRFVSAGAATAIPSPTNVRASVGILDSGVEAPSLEPWVLGRSTFDVAADRDSRHGTFVGGLVVAARSLNSDTALLPSDPALIYDGQVMPGGSITEDLLIERIAEVLAKSGPSGPRVWNCSFNADQPLDPAFYTAFGQELDLMAREHGVMFVQSAGNYNQLRSVWPPDGSEGPADAISSPAEAIDSVTVGALSHLGGKTPRGAVSSYSRRGPSFGGQQKPDVTHYGGDVASDSSLAGFGILSIGPDDALYESVGTSFSTPLVSGIAANVWQDLVDGQGLLHSVDPTLVKALIIHSATVASPATPTDLHKYYGAGIPKGESLALFDLPHTFSTIHEVDLRSGVNWEKRPFPMPASIFTASGKVRAKVSVTVCYSPTIDPAFGEECIRTCVEPSFGHYVTNADGEEEFKGVMGGGHDWERNLVERGKWSPTKTYRQSWTRGIDGSGDWALKLRLTARDQSIEPVVQKAYVIVTIEGLSSELPVREDGIRALAKLRYPGSLLVDSGRIRVRA